MYDCDVFEFPKAGEIIFMITVGLKGSSWLHCFADGANEESGRMRNDRMRRARG
jgi:hypothetical protein